MFKLKKKVIKGLSEKRVTHAETANAVGGVVATETRLRHCTEYTVITQ
ncbi:hypothetical protein ACFFK7_14650 [Pseudoalteromonas xiamenensis]